MCIVSGRITPVGPPVDGHRDVKVGRECSECDQGLVCGSGVDRATLGLLTLVWGPCVVFPRIYGDDLNDVDGAGKKSFAARKVGQFLVRFPEF